MKQYTATISLQHADTIFNLVNTLRANGAVVNTHAAHKHVIVTWFKK